MDTKASNALRLVWATAVGLRDNLGNPKFHISSGKKLTLELDADLSSSAPDPDIEMPVSGGSKVLLQLSKLPTEVQEAISHEDFHM